MPPVRWRLALVLFAIFSFANGEPQKGQISADGWRPIVGQAETQFQDQITQYRNPNKKSEPIKAETPRPTPVATSAPIPPPQSPPPKPTTKGAPLKLSSIPPSGSGKSQMQMFGAKNSKAKAHPMPPKKQQHGPHIPLSPKGHRGPPAQPYKHHLGQQGPAPHHNNGKRHNKPQRGHHEILAGAATSNIGSYAYFNQGPIGIKTRIIHTPSHIDYNNNFAAQNYNNQPIQQFVFPKHPLQNDVYYTFQSQNDEYTRNLVPPPPYKVFPEKEQKVKNFYKPKEQIPVTESIVQNKYKPAEKPIQIQQAPIVHQSHFSNTFQANPASIDIQVTKEKLKVFHNNIPNNYRPIEQYPEFAKPSDAPKLATYEVTEGNKFWNENLQQQQFSTRLPEFHIIDAPSFKQPQRQQQQQPQQTYKSPSTAKPIIEPIQVHFLPTPYIPDLTGPTLPTQSEVSTIYNEIAELNKQKPEPPSYFNIKEVSTHFPIVGKPQIDYNQYSVYDNSQFGEIGTTIKVEDNTKYEEPTPTMPMVTETPKPVQRNPVRRRRPVNRTRTTTTTTAAPDTIIGIVTEAYEAQREHIEPTTRRPVRRRPTRVRTTEKTIEPETVTEPIRKRQRVRVRPTQQTIEEYQMPTNHKMQESEEDKYMDSNYYAQTTEKANYQESLEDQYMESFQKLENDNKASGNINLYDLSNPYHKPSNAIQDTKHFRQPEVKTTEGPTTLHQTEPTEEVYQTTPAYVEPSLNTITIQEVHEVQETTLATTSTTTSTTTEPSTTKRTRIKAQLNKYNRPRFSVKDYKQRLNQYASSTTTTEKTQAAPHSPRVRIPNRFRKPVAPSTPTDVEDNTEQSLRNRFVPNNSRYKNNQEKNEETTTETKPKTRVRYNRYKSTTTTEAPTTTAKVSIKPNLFANRRRPSPISLKSRIANKQKAETTTNPPPEVTTYDSKENEVTKEPEVTEPYEFEMTESTTEFAPQKIYETKIADQATESIDKSDDEQEEEPDNVRNESFMYSQRVSDLTSSAQYDQPGLFKAVSPNTRRVPSYFTIATDDPILPIEAFFPNLNSNNKS